jgi:putative intracellular protease/amidase
MKKALYFIVVLFFFGCNTSENSKDKVLIIASNQMFHADSKMPAGNSFSEIVLAYKPFYEAGYEVDVVSPKGGSIPLSYINTSNDLQRTFLFDFDFMAKLKNTLKPSEVNASDYKIIHYTGGSSPIFDIPQNKEIQDIVMSVYEENNGIVTAVCHGTSGIVDLKTKDGKYLVDGKNVNGVPDSHESKELKHYQYYPFIIEAELVKRGANFKHSKILTAHIEVDGRLVTGQNSLSTKMVAVKAIEIHKNQ